MNETIIKQTTEFRMNLAKFLTEKTVLDLIAATKAAGDSDSGSFEVVVSTADFDRQGESVNQNGWDLSYYQANPVVLWAHDYSSLPIGICTSIEVVMGKLIAKGKFAPESANSFAQQVRRLYDLGMVRATSVGFIPKEFDNMDAGVITRAELLEFSFVPVPANPYALSLSQIKELNIDTSMLRIKGIEIAATPEPKIGDACTTQDGKPGIMTIVTTSADNILLCMPKELNPDNEIDADQMKNFMKSIDERLANIEKTIKPVVALEDKKSLDGDKGAGDDGAEKRSKTSKAFDELNEFVDTRSLLRSVDKSLEIVLKAFNEKARQHEISRKKS